MFGLGIGELFVITVVNLVPSFCWYSIVKKAGLGTGMKVFSFIPVFHNLLLFVLPFISWPRNK